MRGSKTRPIPGSLPFTVRCPKCKTWWEVTRETYVRKFMDDPNFIRNMRKDVK